MTFSCFYTDISTTSEQVASIQPPAEKSEVPAEETPPQEEKKPVAQFEPPSKTELSPTGKSRKKDRRKRKRPPKISVKDEMIRAAGMSLMTAVN
ncbi:hypothetical protein OS493_013326 [Desmophyllum pertusum]|uniref:Uncharacterized protein n=1 Tax=Desmophyllum pertusum TaxID=174260 RepID=A0A9W9YDL6_9CNID|nr:hypothetical protein OS493_013326 [Desmophyllum pertusum]